MSDTHEVTPPAYLAGLVEPIQVRDDDLLLITVSESFRFDDAQRWAAQLCATVKASHGWTVTAIVLPPGQSISHYRPVRQEPT